MTFEDIQGVSEKYLKIHDSSPVITTKEIMLIGDSVKKILVVSIVTDMLKTISVEDFQRCYQKWCVPAQGNSFEGDNIDV